MEEIDKKIVCESGEYHLRGKRQRGGERGGCWGDEGKGGGGNNPHLGGHGTKKKKK